MNEQRIPVELLAALGLESATLGDISRVQLVEDSYVARGFVAATPAQDSAFFKEQADVSLGLDAVDAMGFWVANYAQWQQLVRVLVPEGQAFRWVSSTPAPAVREGESGEYFVEFTQPGGAVAFLNAQNEGVLLYYEGRDLLGAQVLQFPDGLFKTPALTSPIETWLASTQNPWLRQAVRAQLSRGDSWWHWVAVGLFYRFWVPDTREARRQLMQTLLAGGQAEQTKDILSWVQGLPADMVDWLADRTLMALERLHLGLQEIDGYVQDGELVLEAEMREVLTLRDDIECAKVLLYQRAQYQKVVGAIRVVDALGEMVVRALAAEFDLNDDARLFQAVVANPEGWWTRLSGADVEGSEEA